MSGSAFDALVASVRDDPTRVVVEADGERFDGARLWARACGHAARLRAVGLRPGDRVLLVSSAQPGVVAALLGAHLGGFIAVPVNPRYPQAEIAHVLGDSGARAIVCEDRLRPQLPPTEHPVLGIDDDLPVAAAPPLASRPDDDTALLVYTSGTTGRSKGVMLSFGAIAAGMGALTGAWGWTPRDALSLSLPLFHVHGLGIGIYGSLLRKVRVLLHERFDPRETVADFEHRGATVFMGVPTMVRRLIELCEVDPSAAASLRRGRLFTAGSAALPTADLERFEALTGHRILERYGMTETLITLSNPLEGERRGGSVGRPLPSVEIRVVDDQGVDVPFERPGELWVRGPGVMTGYWQRPADTAAAFENGWFKTGDIVTRDPDGYVRIVGRKSVDIIKSGGFKIGAREIEDMLTTHPAVAEVAVIGLPDPTWGERIAAAVVLRPGHAPIPEDRLLAELQALCVAHLADYKKPRRLAILDALPRNPLGKIQKPALRALLTKS